MFKKLFIFTFIISLFFSTNIYSIHASAASSTTLKSTVPSGYQSTSGDQDITSPNMYGTGFQQKLQFDPVTCATNYNRLNKNVADAQIEDYKLSSDESWFAKLADKFNAAQIVINGINGLVFKMGQAITDVIFDAGCFLGIAPSQFLQLMFYPIVLDDFAFLGTISTVIQTISIVVLTVITTLAIYEMNKREGSITQELISKVGKFLLAAGIIAFSKYFLQGIFDIANILGYFVSNYNVNIHMDGASGTVSVNLLDYPTIFITYLEFAFSPKVLNQIPAISGVMLSVLIVVKIICYFFMLKDLSKIAVYGMKRIMTLVASPVLIPVLAGLLPSDNTSSIFGKYFRSVISSSFVPVLFGLIYLASAPFVIEDLVHYISAPILKIMVLLFFLNILASLPGFAEHILQHSHKVSSTGSDNFANFRSSARNNVRAYGEAKSSIKAQAKASGQRYANTKFHRVVGKQVANNIRSSIGLNKK